MNEEYEEWFRPVAMIVHVKVGPLRVDTEMGFQRALTRIPTSVRRSVMQGKKCAYSLMDTFVREGENWAVIQMERIE